MEIGPRTSVRLTESELLDLVSRALVRHGMSESNAAPVSAVIAAAERDGARSHGLLRLPGYLASLRSGNVDGTVTPVVTRPTPVLLAVDGANGFAQVALAAVREQAIDAARTMGLAAISIRHAHHFASLWPDVEPFAERGLLALSMVNTRSHLVSWGGKKKVLGTNPFAFACPREGRPPVVWDQASSTRAQGEVILSRNSGHQVPEGVGVDAEGRDTTDPAAILDGGALLPFSGAKGGNVAFMVEVLVAAFGGGPFGFEVDPKTHTGRTGQFVLLLCPGRLGHSDFGVRIEQLITEFERAGVSRLPAERRYANRARSEAGGIAVCQAQYDTLMEAIGTR